MSEKEIESIRKILVKANNAIWDMSCRSELISELQEICKIIIEEFNFEEFVIGEDYIEEE